MKRTIPLCVLALLASLAFPAVARADHRRPRWGIDLGFGWQGGHVSVGLGGYRPAYRPRHVHVHTRTPIYEQVWVPPVYQTVFVGTTRCGSPIYEQVQIRCGYYRSILVGHRCGGCGAACD